MKTSLITIVIALTTLLSSSVEAASCKSLPQVNKPTLKLVKTYEEHTVDLQKDLKEARACIVDSLSSKVTLNANQYGALVSWAYSIGCEEVKTSDLIDRLNKHREPINKVVQDELPKWSEDGDLAVADPVTRRNDEVRLFNTNSFDDALPCKN